MYSIVWVLRGLQLQREKTENSSSSKVKLLLNLTFFPGNNNIWRVAS